MTLPESSELQQINPGQAIRSLVVISVTESQAYPDRGARLQQTTSKMSRLKLLPIESPDERPRQPPAQPHRHR
jgi:hypothetical protein